MKAIMDSYQEKVPEKGEALYHGSEPACWKTSHYQHGHSPDRGTGNPAQCRGRADTDNTQCQRGKGPRYTPGGWEGYRGSRAA